LSFFWNGIFWFSREREYDIVIIAPHPELKRSVPTDPECAAPFVLIESRRHEEIISDEPHTTETLKPFSFSPDPDLLDIHFVAKKEDVLQF